MTNKCMEKVTMSLVLKVKMYIKTKEDITVSEWLK
jgi:hypothetical protein